MWLLWASFVLERLISYAPVRTNVFTCRWRVCRPKFRWALFYKLKQLDGVFGSGGTKEIDAHWAFGIAHHLAEVVHLAVGYAGKV